MVDAEQKSIKQSDISRITVKDIAVEAGVSVSTVSRALANDPVIAKETRERVMMKAKEMGYRPNFFARGLIRQRSGVVALFVNNITNPFYPEVLVKLSRRLQKMKLHTMIFTSDDGVEDSVPALQEINPDVAILLAATMKADYLQEFNDSNTPVILFNRYVAGASASAICCDNTAGGRLVAERLAQSGYRHLAFIEGLATASTNVDRLAGYLEGIAASGLPDPVIYSGGDFSYENGYAGMRQLYARDQRIDAVFCANDIIAVGASDCIRRELGLRVPEDIAIVGFDDIALASWPSHDLTTVRQPMDDMIDCVITEILRFQQNRSAMPKQYFMPGELIIRGSANLADGRVNE
ncbi:LacI family DNA-binding transcriptional regulator [Halomonas sp. A40-4]|uniref:LacI family DNA-binding transcriptional regulator n=1 Tax=Halomonas sp. A40-4 TaxID=2785909 RepID=UPI0018F04FBF|nr:LacI family DNA-binding transcriptional regulator [Halomonas sp. A40-4]QPL47272.1 LacI family DNA-binding transcriptional regulator [Halomonas sp. A40-4]